jgi:hypothetical protein
MLYENPDLLHRYKEKLELSEEEAVILFDDTKRFLYLCGTNGGVWSPPRKVDTGWHEFLMFTEDYANFCQQFFGRFIHHCPRRITDEPTNGIRTRNTVRLAIATFGGGLSSNWSVPVSGDALAEDPCDSCGCNAAI